MHHRCWFFFVVVRRRREFRAISESGMFNVMPTENFKNFAVFGLSSCSCSSSFETSLFDFVLRFQFRSAWKHMQQILTRLCSLLPVIWGAHRDVEGSVLGAARVRRADSLFGQRW
jgi:hypothetical protein